MKGRGTRLCEDVNKRYFTIFDYSGASALEDAEFDGHPANKQPGSKPKKRDSKTGPGDPKTPNPVAENVHVILLRLSIDESYLFGTLQIGKQV